MSHSIQTEEMGPLGPLCLIRQEPLAFRDDAMNSPPCEWEMGADGGGTGIQSFPAGGF